ncbi:MAG: hypothetical protein V1915_02265 [Candidatus Bathyarchaeota archaeon]
MSEVYEMFVKEYLEFVEEFSVRLDCRFKKNRGWSDIDIIGIKIKNGNSRIIVGEVKAKTLSKKDIDNEIVDFEHPALKQRILELFGNENYEKWIFCWTMKEKELAYAKSVGINIKQFPEIIDELFKIIENEREQRKRWIYEKNYPNLILVQMIHEFLKSNKIHLTKTN